MNYILLLILVVMLGLIMLAVLFISVIFIYFMLESGFMHYSPPVPTCGKVKTAMINEVAENLRTKKNMTIMDLGSGWGTLLLPLAKQFSQHKFIGIEKGFLPYWVSRFRARNLKNITFIRQNFFMADISQADVIFLFLLPKVMENLEQKCRQETKKNALIYVNRFPMNNIKPLKEINLGSKYYTYYVYKF